LRSKKVPFLAQVLSSERKCVIGVFFGIELLQLYNQTRYFSLPYAMLIAIFMILGAIGLFMGLTLNVIAKLKVNGGK
jgi:hypothetical protein